MHKREGGGGGLQVLEYNIFKTLLFLQRKLNGGRKLKLILPLSIQDGFKIIYEY